MDEDELIRWKILHALYRLRKAHGPYERLPLYDLAEDLSIKRDVFMSRYALDLENLGLIDIVDVGGGTVITQKGMALIDKKNPFLNDTGAGTRSIIINAPVSGSAIIQG